MPRHHLPAAPLGLVATASASDLAMDCPETRQPLADGWHPLQRSAEQQRTTIAAAAAPAGHPHTHERVPRHHLLATPLALAAAASASDPAMDCPETRRPVGDGLREQGRSAEQQLKLKLSVLTLSQRLVTPRTPRVSGARLGVQPLQLPEIPIHYKWGPQ